MPVKTNEWYWPDEFYFSFDDMEEQMNWLISYHDFDETELFTLSPYGPYGNIPDFFGFNTPMNDIMKPTADLKSQIRNHDCMWSGRCVAHPEKTKSTTKYRSNVNNINTPATTTSSTSNTVKSSQQIAPGRSLLLNPRNNNYNNTIAGKRIQNSISRPASHVPTITTNEFLKDRDTTGSNIRPDTPLSIDDDVPEFKHTIDLAACTMGSNHMSLVNPEDATPQQIITFLKEHLETTSINPESNTPIKSEIEPFFAPKNHSLTDIIQYLQEDGLKMNDNASNSYEDDSEDESDNDCSSSQSICSSGYYTISPSVSIEDSKHGILDDYSSASTPIPSSHSANLYNNQRSNNMVTSNSILQNGNNITIKQEYQATDVGDHCYTTRCENTDALGVLTPSDSGELILFFFFLYLTKLTINN